MPIKNNKAPTPKYACCPSCATVIIQGELAKNVIVKCPNCKRRVLVQISHINITTKEVPTTHQFIFQENAESRSFFS